MTPPERLRRGAARGSDAKGLSKRLDDLSARIAAESAEHAPPPARAADGARYGIAIRLASEFVAAVLVGAFLGWLFDRLAGTSPFGLIILLLLGFGAGLLNMARTSARMSNTTPQPPARAVPDDEDEEN